jgi:hypothetical protein
VGGIIYLNMKEILNYGPFYEPAGNPQSAEISKSGVPEDAGEIEVALDTEEVLLFAYEQAGKIKSLEDLLEPIETIETSPDAPIDEIGDLNEIKSLAQFELDEEKRSKVQQKITQMINKRRSYTEQDKLDLWAHARMEISHNGIPQVLDIIRQMTSSFSLQVEQPVKVTIDAEELAGDIYWMIQREEIDRKKNRSAA